MSELDLDEMPHATLISVLEKPQFLISKHVHLIVHNLLRLEADRPVLFLGLVPLIVGMMAILTYPR